jgi:hypothetical protein
MAVLRQDCGGVVSDGHAQQIVGRERRGRELQG